MALSDKQIITTLFKDKLSVGNTRTNREFFEEALKSSFVVKPQNLWMYGDMIPAEGSSNEDLSTIKQMENGEIYTYNKDESTVIPLIKKYVDYELKPIDAGTDNAFKLVEVVDGIEKIITDVIPFNYYKNIYNYTLKNSENETIPFGVGDWVFDTFSSILTFNGELPPNVDHDHLPKLTFYRYIGGKGFRNDMHGYEAALVPITNITIPANTFTFYAGTNGNSLQKDIISQANKVEDQFVASYGWDGADENEGIATSLEVLSPLTYSVSKDKVKGYDDSKDSQIYVLLTKAFLDGAISGDFDSTIKYISNKVAEGEHFIKVSVTANEGEDSQMYLSFDDGPAKLYQPDTEILLTGPKGFIVLDTPLILTSIAGEEDYKYTFNVKYDLSKKESGNTQAGLFYYSIKEGTLLPFHTQEENVYDISFPVVTLIGKIPPSVKLNAITLDSLDDTITPDYYGPRVYNVILAQEGTEQIKSADYIIKNKDNFYLKDILNKIHDDKSSGSIYFRAGTYKIIGENEPNPILDASLFNFNANIIFHGEDLQLVKITSDNACTINIDSTYLTSFQNIEFDPNITLNINVSGPVTFNYIKAKNVNIIRNSDCAFSILHSDITNLSIGGSSTAEYIISDSSFVDININSANGIFNNIIVQTLNVEKNTKFIGCTLGKCAFREDANVIGCTISNLIAKTEKAIFRDCYIENYSEDIEDITGVPRLETFPIYNKNGLLKYVNIANPILYDSANNIFSVKYDKETIFINENGELHVSMDSSQIAVKDADKWERDSAYEASKADMSEDQKTDTYNKLNHWEPGVTSIEDILQYIVKYKADLINGKIPLQNLPDSVAYGGLHYCGLWSIETYHRLPSFNDIKSIALTANYDQEVEELQPGWFCIIDNSSKDQNPTKVQKLLAATADDSNGLSKNDLLLSDYLAEEYTAGDWIIFEGYENNNGKRVLDENGQPIPIWSKIDRSYHNPIFTRIPSKDPNGLHWTWENGGTGTLDFNDDTIYEALYEINNELNKLQVQKPYILSKFTFVPEQEYAKIKVLKIEDDNNKTTAFIGDESEFYNIEEINTFRTTTSLGNDWRSYIYFGTKADFTGYLYYGKDTEINNIKEYMGVGTNNNSFRIDDAIDPFTNELIGKGYWKGTKLHIDISNIKEGEYTVFASEDNINPLFQNISSQTTNVSHFNFIHSKHDIKALMFIAAELNTEELKNTYVRYTSGLPYISTVATDAYGAKASYKVSFTLSKGFYKYLNPECFIQYQTSFDDIDTWHSFDELKANSSEILISKRDTDLDYYDLTVKSLACPIPENTIGLHQFKLTVRVFDILGNYKDIEIYQRPIFDLIGQFNETNRVCSGKAVTDPYAAENPTVGTSSTEGEAGNIYIANETLNTNIELMCENFVKEDNTIGMHYIWPKGKYNNIDNTKEYNYSEFEEEHQLMPDGSIMRYVSFIADDISESNGFTLIINGSNIVMDPLTGINKNMSIQVLIKGDDTWYNANKPMGYLEDPVNTNDACMYAGKSTAYVKRISFGQRLLTGKILIRIGIKKDSNIVIENIRIEDIV